ncbi:MAG: formyltransferase family protein, partial [Dehalococcoidia bacterium]|nr:formyltransferase family protein [Dehalococcoidia bacterium]
MRTVLTGQAAFGAQVLEALIKRGDEVVGVFTGQQPGAAGPLKEVAEKSGLPLFQPARMKDPEVYEQFRNLNADLGVLAFVTDIVPGNVLRCPRLGSIQYHPSLLPRHRGASAMHWAVIDGDVRTGLTVFWADEGIDTGNILLQKEAEIGPDDTRITTRYDEHFLPTALFGILHEAGHGIYEQGLQKEWYGLPPGQTISLGIHESQSRI